jgi:HlyD family secretion protein
MNVRMNDVRSIARSALLAAALTVGVAPGCKGDGPGGAAGEREPRTPSRAAEAPKRRATVAVAGAVRTTRQVAVGTEIGGVVADVLVDASARVKKGQALARLDTAALEAEAARSRARLGVAEAGAKGARAAVAGARALLQRYRQVADRTGGKVPSAGELARAQAELAQAEAEESGARAALAEARVSLAWAEAKIARATIRSPIDGVVLSRRAEPGEAVGGLQAPLFVLAQDLAELELEAGIDQMDVSQVQAGQPATVIVDAWPGRRYEGRVVRIGFDSRRQGGTVVYPMAIRLKNTDLSLRPGMTGRAEIATASVRAPRS